MTVLDTTSLNKSLSRVPRYLNKEDFPYFSITAQLEPKMIFSEFIAHASPLLSYCYIFARSIRKP